MAVGVARSRTSAAIVARRLDRQIVGRVESDLVPVGGRLYVVAEEQVFLGADLDVAEPVRLGIAGAAEAARKKAEDEAKAKRRKQLLFAIGGVAVVGALGFVAVRRIRG